MRSEQQHCTISVSLTFHLNMELSQLAFKLTLQHTHVLQRGQGTLSFSCFYTAGNQSCCSYKYMYIYPVCLFSFTILHKLHITSVYSLYPLLASAKLSLASLLPGKSVYAFTILLAPSLSLLCRQ